MIRRTLLDLTVLIALTESQHPHYRKALDWFDHSGHHAWALCPLTEAGFIRVTTNPSYHPAMRTLDQSTTVLRDLRAHPGYSYWEIAESWVDLTSGFAARITGPQQVTDAYLLGLAIKKDGVLVTFDRGLRYLAGDEFARNLLILQ